MSKISVLLILAVFIGASYGFCVWPKSGGTINVCKNTGKSNCMGVGSSDTCINLVGGPFVSGFSSGNYQCKIFSSTGCSGSMQTVDRDGWSKFPLTPKSIRCPCV